jgi:DinB family protein
MNSDVSRYPIGKFSRVTEPLDAASRLEAIAAIERAPGEIRALVAPLTDAELEKTYREGGWTIRQVVHHVPDSHMNAYVRIKMALTESAPAIKAYDEARWAELADARSGPVGFSLDLLDSLHHRWVTLLRALSAEDFLRTYVHPELGPVHLDEALALYAWHGRHHTAHIRNALSP